MTEVSVPTTEGVYYGKGDRELLARVMAREESFSAFTRRSQAFLLAFLDILDGAEAINADGEVDWERAAVEERMALVLYEKVRESSGVAGLPNFEIPDA